MHSPYFANQLRENDREEGSSDGGPTCHEPERDAYSFAKPMGHNGPAWTEERAACYLIKGRAISDREKKDQLRRETHAKNKTLTDQEFPVGLALRRQERR